jgi:hypothetical protein
MAIEAITAPMTRGRAVFLDSDMRFRMACRAPQQIDAAHERTLHDERKGDSFNAPCSPSHIADEERTGCNVIPARKTLLDRAVRL